MMEEELVKGSPKIAAADASYVAKAGKHTEGLGNFWNGCKGKSEKGLARPQAVTRSSESSPRSRL